MTDNVEYAMPGMLPSFTGDFDDDDAFDWPCALCGALVFSELGNTLTARDHNFICIDCTDDFECEDAPWELAVTLGDEIPHRLTYEEEFQRALAEYHDAALADAVAFACTRGERL